MFRVLLGAIMATSTIAALQPSPASAGNETIPYYDQLLPACPAQRGVPADPCHTPGSESDAPGIVVVPCDAARSVTNFCYTATVNGNPAPSTLKVLALMTAYKLHDTTVSNAQLEANVVAYYVPAGAELDKGELWGWGKRPSDQTGNGGKVNLSPVLSETDVLKVVIKYKTHKMPQYNVFVASDASMDFALSGQDLTITMEGKPARVAIESAAQHIDFDTEKSDDTTLPWTNRCGVPSMRFVVCNVDKAESNPLVFYARSSSFANSPGADVPGPIWVSTNATYFHQPSVSVDAKGNRQIQVKVAAPHFLADGTTVNSGSFRTFLSNGILQQWGITKTEDGLNKALATSVKKAGVETVIERTFTIGENGVTVTFPNLTYSSPEVYVTSVATTGGSQNANQVYAALLAGAGASAGGSSSTTTAGTKSLKKGSSTALTSLIKPTSGLKSVWSVSGGCRIIKLKLAAITKGASCKLTLSQTNTKTKKTTKKYLSIKVT